MCMFVYYKLYKFFKGSVALPLCLEKSLDFSVTSSSDLIHLAE